jgi:pimeloyl-ACP methyl ester carboxylesterase
MFSMNKRIIIVFVCLLLLTCTTLAQDAPLLIELEAEDGLLLQGDYWASNADSMPEEGVPAVLLLHIVNSSRDAWQPLIEPLLAAGYHVLAVDMRGHGATGGSKDWPAAETDVQLWLDWLKEQPNTQSVFIIGGSIGSNLALIGCANDPDCRTAIALSPGLDFFDVMPENAVVEELQDRPVLLIASHDDSSSAIAVRQMASNSRGEIAMRIYNGRAHGTSMLTSAYGERLISLIVNWLDEHTQPIP